MFTDFKDYQPVATGGGLSAAYGAIVAAVVAFGPQFGVELDQNQIAALVGLWAVVEAALSGWQWHKVYPAVKIDDTKDNSLIHDGT